MLIILYFDVIGKKVVHLCVGSAATGAVAGDISLEGEEKTSAEVSRGSVQRVRGLALTERARWVRLRSTFLLLLLALGSGASGSPIHNFRLTRINVRVLTILSVLLECGHPPWSLGP